MRYLLIVALFCASLLAFKDFGIVGNLVEPVEPDMMEEIIAKGKDFNKTKIKSEVSNSLEKKLKISIGLKSCEVNASRKYTPSYTLKEDAIMPGGKILYPRGYKFNPLSKLNFNFNLAFIDGNDIEQIKLAQKKGINKIFITSGNISEIERKYKIRVEPASQEMLNAFDVNCAPSFYSPNNDDFLIDEFSVRELKNDK